MIHFAHQSMPTMQLTSSYTCATIHLNKNRAPPSRRARHKSGGVLFYDSLNPTQRLAGRCHFPGDLGQLPRTVRLLPVRLLRHADRGSVLSGEQ
ncbi:hypothetical protein EMIT0P395_10202 [Pseudomonas sp. IT-P395]